MLFLSCARTIVLVFCNVYLTINSSFHNQEFYCLMEFTIKLKLNKRERQTYIDLYISEGIVYFITSPEMSLFQK